jgi:antirestriction protein ArdC
MVRNIHFIEKMEQGAIPCQQSWSAFGPAANYLTRKPYRGINQLILRNMHPRPFYLTYKQVLQLGGQVTRGSQSIPITFWQVLFRLKENGRRISAEEASILPAEKTTRAAMLRYYRVFNIDDTEGIQIKLPEVEVLSPAEKILSCERIIAEMPDPPKIGHQGNQAFYHPGKDYQNMPRLHFFSRAELYYSVIFHELVHSTGHSKRLNRPELTKITAFGTHEYSQEELTAEIGASFLNCHAGNLNTLTFEDSAAYLQGWLQKLRNDKKFIFTASAKAQKAVDYILNQ